MDENDAYPFPPVAATDGGPPSSDNFKVFQGEGKRLDGKKKNLIAPEDASAAKT